MSAADSFTEAREALVREVRGKGITDERVLQALGRVRRECFVPDDWRDEAYRDSALPIDLEQTISQPFTVAYQTEWLEVQPGERVLEIGTGSGYQAAVLAELGARVWSIERHHALHLTAAERLKQLGYTVQLRWGDGRAGWAEAAPFDAILITAGAAEVPNSLLRQLKVPDSIHRGGRLIAPVGSENYQVMQRWTCTAPGEFSQERRDTFRFVPLLPGVSGHEKTRLEGPG